MSARRLVAAPILSLALAASLGACAAETTTAPASTHQDPAGDTDTTPVPNVGTTLSYRFGAKFEPPVGRVVHGVGQWLSYNVKYAALLPAAGQPASELLFLNPVDTIRPWNPAQIAAAFAGIEARGRIPLADITLHGNNPTPAELAAMPDPLYGQDDEVANSAKWDSRILDIVSVIKAHKKPVMLRIGGEFNGSWSGYHPYVYPKAFRKIVAMFRAAGVENVAFVWCYEPAGPEDFDAKSTAGEYKWYPGDDMVDWFSIDLYSKNDIAGATIAHNALTAYGRTLKLLDMAVAAQKPVVIAESSPEAYDVAVSGPASWTEWFAPYFALIASRPEIEWFTYVNYDWMQATYYANQGWKNNDLSVNASLASQYAGELAKAKYLHAGERVLLKDYANYK